MITRRTCVIKLRVSPDEFIEIRTRAGGGNVAGWLRGVALKGSAKAGGSVDRQQDALVRAAALLGNQLDQLSELVEEDETSLDDFCQLRAVLDQINQSLKNVLRGA